MIFINTICASRKHFETGCKPVPAEKIQKAKEENIIETNKSFLNKILNI